MKINKIFYILGLTATTLGFVACDKVEPKDRYIEMEKVKAARVVLLEEYTGQTCTNCPDAHRTVAQLLNQYAGNLISVSIHAGNFGIPEGKYPTMVGLMQPEGDEYAQAAKVSIYPSGVVNRRSGACTMDKWSDFIRTFVQEESNISINGRAVFKPGANNIEIYSTLSSSDNISVNYQVWVVESGIVAFQIDHGVGIQDYVHNHVYRASVNGTWGEGQNIVANRYTELTHSIAVKSNWNVKNLKIVTFAYNNAEGVLQAAEFDIEEDAEEI